MNAVAYRRVSTMEQGESGAGLDAQTAAIEQAVRVRGWHLVGDHHDIISGSGTRKLPGREAALAQCAQTGAALVCAKLDRLGRSALDIHRIDEHSRKHGYPLVLLDIGIDTSTPMGRAMMGMAAVFAQLERDMIGARTRDALEARRLQGVTLGRPASIAPDVRALIRELHAADWSQRQIAEFLNRAGVATARGGAVWRPSSLKAALA